MEVILNFKDGDLEVVKSVRSIADFDSGVEVRDNELHVTRYEKSDIRNIEVVWR